MLVALVVCLATACTGSGGTNHSTQPLTETARPSVQHQRFQVVGSPPPPGERCLAPSREAGGYAVLIGPTGAKPGSPVTMGGNTPLFNEAHHYRGPKGKIGFWFNLPFGAWTEVYSSLRPPRVNRGVPVIHLGEAKVKGQCSYRVTFNVPDVPPGVYDIVPIEHGEGSSSAFLPLEFRVPA